MLSTILDLTDQVQAAIDAGEWQRAQELETERHRQLERLVAEQNNGVQLTATLESLQQRNHRMIGVVQHHRRRVLREAATVKSGEQGAAAYAETHADAP